MVKRTKRTNKQITAQTTRRRKQRLSVDRAPLKDHLREVKRRIVYIVLSIALCSALVYGVERKLIEILLRPSHGQHFVYTSPMGGINFLFNVCFYFGIALSMPVIFYNILQFLRPLIRRANQRFIVLSSIASGFIALGGIAFGYFAGLPAALHFLLKQQFHSGQVEAFISIEKYFSFVVAYMTGAALMFQLPLLLIILNRIKPLTPKKMFKYERAVILFSFVSAFIMNPTPNVVDQMLTVIPVLISYQLGIGIVWLINKYDVHRRYSTLFEKDETLRQERLARVQSAQALPSELLPAAVTEPIPIEPIQLATVHKKSPQLQTAIHVARPSPRYLPPRPSYATASPSRLIQL